MPPKGYKALNHRRKVTTRDLTLASGSTITLTLTGVDALELTGEDRAFVFSLIDIFAAYEAKQVVPDQVPVALSRV